MRPFLRKIRPYCIGIVVGLILAGGIAAAQMEFDLSRILPFEANRLWLMKQTRSLLETYHVDGDEAREEDKLFYGAVKGMVSACSWASTTSLCATTTKLWGEHRS